MTTAHRRFKDAIYEQLARVGKAVSAPKRLELLDLLCQGPRTVEALAEQAASSRSPTPRSTCRCCARAARRRGEEGALRRVPARRRRGVPLLRRAARTRRGAARRGRAGRPRVLRAARRDGGRRGQRALAAREERRGHRARCPSRRGVPRRAHPGRALDSGRGAEGATEGAAEGSARSSPTAVARIA
jgi:hypothetical protein